VACPGAWTFQVSEDTQPVLQAQDRDGGLGGEGDQDAHAHAAWEILIRPNRAAVLEGSGPHLQETDPPRNAGQVAQQIIAGLHLLDGSPAPSAES
jgi:hypothetical protein